MPWLSVSIGLKPISRCLSPASKHVEERLDKMALRSELLELKARVDALQEQVRTLEARLDGQSASPRHAAPSGRST